MSSARAAVNGSGQAFTSLIETSAGIVGVDPDGIWLSADNGATFSNVYSDTLERYSALATSGTTVVAVGETGLVLRSINGGSNWSAATAPGVFSDLISVATDGNGVWLATGDRFSASLLRSVDDGQTWSELSAPAATSLRALAWQADTGWILAGEGDAFSGLIYRSTDDGANWQLLAGGLGAPVNAVAINGSGLITVVGQSGLMLQGTIASAFTAPAGYTPISQDLYAVSLTATGDFIAGGETGTLLAINGAGVEDKSLANDSDITAILSLANDDLLISGDYQPPLPQERTIPFELLLSRDALSGDYILTVMETLTDRTYRIESSTNLQSWDEVIGSERAGNGATQVWTFPAAGTRLFWRAIEL